MKKRLKTGKKFSYFSFFHSKLNWNEISCLVMRKITIFSSDLVIFPDVSAGIVGKFKAIFQICFCFTQFYIFVKKWIPVEQTEWVWAVFIHSRTFLQGLLMMSQTPWFCGLIRYKYFKSARVFLEKLWRRLGPVWFFEDRICDSGCSESNKCEF